MDKERLIQNIINEALRIEEDTEYSAKGHFNAASRWSTIHYWIGVPMTICAGAAGAQILQNSTDWVAILALLAASLGAILTFINPEKSAINHKNAGGRYLSLRNETRNFRTIELYTLSAQEASERIKNLSSQRNELNELSLIIPEWAFIKARKGIEKGESKYIVDSQDKEIK